MVFRRWIFFVLLSSWPLDIPCSIPGSLDNRNHSRIARHASNSTLLDDNSLATALFIFDFSLEKFSSLRTSNSHNSSFLNRYTRDILGLSAPLEAYTTRFLFD